MKFGKIKIYVIKQVKRHIRTVTASPPVGGSVTAGTLDAGHFLHGILT
jgi:hypothetical protein